MVNGVPPTSHRAARREDVVQRVNTRTAGVLESHWSRCRTYAKRPSLADQMPFPRVLLLSLLCAGAAGQAVLTASDLDSSASAVAGALESYTVGSDPSFWSNSATYSADFQTVVVGTKLTFHYSSQHDVTVAASADDWTQCAVQNGDVVASRSYGGGIGAACSSGGACCGGTCGNMYEAVVTSVGELYVYCRPHCQGYQKIKFNVVEAPPSPPSMPRRSPPPPRAPRPGVDSFVGTEPYALVFPKPKTADASFANIGGTLLMQSKGATVTVVGLLTGLPASKTVAASIYSGFGCDDPAPVGTAYSSATSLTADVDGTVDVDMKLAGGAAASKGVGSFPVAAPPPHPPPAPPPPPSSGGLVAAPEAQALP